MKPTNIHWQLIRAVNRLWIVGNLGLTAESIANFVGLDFEMVETSLLEMTYKEFGDFGPWLSCSISGRFAIDGRQRDQDSSGGYAALQHAKDNPHLEVDPSWKNRQLTEGQTLGQNPVIPKKINSPNYTPPEESAHRTNEAFREDPPVVETKLRLCPACDDHKKKELRENQKYCNACRRRKYRKKKKG